MTPELTLYFDESGFTGNDTSNPEQRNLFLAAVCVPAESEAFWTDIDTAWCHAATHMGIGPNSLEVKGTDVYGGKGQFQPISLEHRITLLDEVAASIVTHRIEILWDGFPKDRWAARVSTLPEKERPPLWQSAIIAFCSELHDVAACRYGSTCFRIIGDENNWVRAGNKLCLDVSERWSCLVDGGILFQSSRDHRGLQLADILVHTLYRTNKTQLVDLSRHPTTLSRTDQLAVKYCKRIHRAGLWINLTSQRIS